MKATEADGAAGLGVGGAPAGVPLGQERSGGRGEFPLSLLLRGSEDRGGRGGAGETGVKKKRR